MVDERETVRATTTDLEGADGARAPARKKPRRTAPATPSDTPLTSASSELLARHGYVVLPSLLTATELDFLRAESTELFASLHENPGAAVHKLVENGCVLDTMAACPMQESDDARVDQHAYLTARSKQVAMAGNPDSTDSTRSPSTLATLLFKRLPRLVAQLVGAQSEDTMFFFNEHYVVKPPQTNVEFRWHRDDDEQLAMCVHRDTIAPYTSVWCALDDVTLDNGPLRFVSVDRLGALQEPTKDELETLAREPLCVAAGAVVVFCSNVWHCSASNTSSTLRRAFYAQYSRTPITATPRADAPLSFAIPCDPQQNSDEDECI